MPLAFLIGIRWGPVGVAAAWFVQPIISLPLQARYVWSRIGVSWGAWFRALWPAISSAALMSLAVFSVSRLGLENAIALLVVQTLVGGVAYFASLWFGHRSAAMAAINFVARRKAPTELAPGSPGA